MDGKLTENGFPLGSSSLVNYGGYSLVAYHIPTNTSKAGC
jgi:hypothetical protein